MRKLHDEIDKTLSYQYFILGQIYPGYYYQIRDHLVWARGDTIQS
jgi:hypothetical protein